LYNKGRWREIMTLGLSRRANLILTFVLFLVLSTAVLTYLIITVGWTPATLLLLAGAVFSGCVALLRIARSGENGSA